MGKCIGCGYGTPKGSILCDICLQMAKNHFNRKKKQGWQHPVKKRSVEDIAQQIREKLGEDAAQRYLEGIRPEARYEEAVWIRHNGSRILVKDMTRYHLSGALGIVNEYAQLQQEKTGKPYLECVPKVYGALKFYAERKGLTVPDFVEYEVEKEHLDNERNSRIIN